MRVGTANYESEKAARIAYGHGYDAAIKEGRIQIGKPELKPGEKLLIDKHSRRYFIETKD